MKMSFLNAPYERDPNFLHRKSLQEQIDEGIILNRPLALCGRAGTGKTHAAVHFAYSFYTKPCEQENMFVLWIDARSVHSIITSFHAIALQLELPVIDEPRSNACQLVAEWLEEKRSDASFEYLVFLDGLESSDMLHKPLRLASEFRTYSEPTQPLKALWAYLSPANNNELNLFVTTRSQDVAESLNLYTIKVTDFSADEAQSMCVMINNDTLPIASHLGTNPLVVRMAAGYLKHSGISLEDYVAIIASSSGLVDSSSPTNFPTEFCENLDTPTKPNRLAAVISETVRLLLSNYDQLDKEDQPNAFERLCLVVGSGGNNVPLWDFAKSSHAEDTTGEGPALDTLMTLGFVHRSQPGKFTMSNIVRQGFWSCAGPFSKPVQSDSLAAVTMLFERIATDGRGKAHTILPLTEVVLSYSESNPQSQADLLATRADYYLSLNFYEEAWRDANSVYQINRTMFGDDSDCRSVASSLHRLGQVTNNMGNYELALQIHRLALDKIETLADVDRLRLTCTTDLAMTLGRLERHQEAADLYRKAISDGEKAGGKEIEVMNYTALLGGELCHLGQIDEALELQERAYKELVQLSGEESRVTRDALSELIQTLTKQQEWTTALRYSEHLLELQEATEGREAFATLAAVGSLAHLLYEVGNKEQSYKCYRRAIDGYTARLGPDHPHTKIVQHNYNALFRERLVTI